MTGTARLGRALHMSDLTKLTAALALSAIAVAVPARAEIPEGARVMIDAAIATGDAGKVAAVLDIARTTFPADTAEIDAIAAKFQAQLAVRTEQEAAAKRETIAKAGIFDLWKGEGELGGFQSSGNTKSVGLAAGLTLKREGLKWSHLLKARTDYQSQDGTTSREQVTMSYEPRWQFSPKVFAYGLAQYEHDRIQGFSGRYAVSGGLGYRVLDRDGLSLAVKAGPAYRVTDFVDGHSEDRIAGLAGFDLDWQILDRVKLTQDANALAETGSEATLIFDGSNTSLNFITGLDFKLSDRLNSRLSYQVDYDSNPPTGAVSTDTLTRATITYGF